MSRRSQNRNQYETTTVGELAAGAFSVTVDSAAGLITDQDMYLVIEPDVPGQREWILIESITGNQFNIANPNGRNLTGSDGDLTHPAGSKIRSVPSQQIFEDIFQDTEDDELAFSNHEDDAGNPHAPALYLKVADTDALYVKLVGDTMTGLLILSADPSAALGAATMQYTDAAQQAAEDFASGLDHDHATPIAVHAALADVHHVAFVEADADLLYLPLGGGALTGELDMSGNAIFGLPTPNNDGDAASKGYVDGEIFSGNHDNLAGVSTSDHHVRYSDANARSAVDNGTYLKLAGGTMSGDLNMGDSTIRNSQPFGCDVYNTAAQNLNNGSWTVMAINTERYDDHQDFNTGNSRYTAPEAGLYAFGCSTRIDSIPSDYRVGVFHITGATYEQWGVDIVGGVLTVFGMRQMTGGQWLQPAVYVNIGSTFTLANFSRFWVAKVA